MNSLEELNVYGSTFEIDYADWRPADVIFSNSDPSDLTVIEFRDYNNLVPAATDIQEIIQYDQCLVNYTIDVSTITGSTVSWSEIPTNCVVTNPSTGVYNISGINSASIWGKIRNPIVTHTSTGTFSYTVSINYLDKTVNWVVNTTIYNLFSQVSNYNFNNTFDQSVTGYPLIDNIASLTDSWTVEITSTDYPNLIDTMYTSGTGGTTSFSNKILTITGTKDQVNSHLASIKFTPYFDTKNITMQYKLKNNLNQNINIVRNQNWIQQQTSVPSVLTATSNFTYTSNSFQSVTGYPLINDVTVLSKYTWIVEITSTDYPYIISSMYTSGTGGSSSYNPLTNKLTITGTKDQVNSHLASITYSQVSEYYYSNTIKYELFNTYYTFVNEIKSQQFINENITLLGLTRNASSYVSGAESLITGGPLITDDAYTGPNYYTLDITPFTDQVSNIRSTGNFSLDEVYTAPIADGAYQQVVMNSSGTRVVYQTVEDQITKIRILDKINDEWTPAPTITIPTLGFIDMTSDGNKIVYINSDETTSYTYTFNGTDWLQTSETFSTILDFRSGYVYIKNSGDLIIYESTNSIKVIVLSNNEWNLFQTITPPGYNTSRVLDILNFTNNGNTLLIRENGGDLENQSKIHIYKFTNNQYTLFQTLLYNDFVNSVSISADENYIAVAFRQTDDSNRKIDVYKLNVTYQLIDTISQSQINPFLIYNYFTSVALNENGSILIACSPDYKISTYSNLDDTYVERTNSDPGYGITVDISSDGFSIVSCTSEELFFYTVTDSIGSWTGTKYTITGLKNILNSNIDNIFLTSNGTSNFLLEYKVTTPTNGTARRLQQINNLGS